MTKTITISDETYNAIKDQLTSEEKVDVSDMEDFVGKKLFIRTVTMHLTGKVERVVGNLLELSDAAWIADSGRFYNAIKDGTLNEVEPVGQMWVNVGTIVDMTVWKHDLPVNQS